MKIKRIKFQNYTVFEDQQMEFSPGINVIIGENGTGKTHLMKALYSACQSADKKTSFSHKLVMTMLPDDYKISRLITRKTGNRTAVIRIAAKESETDRDRILSASFHGKTKKWDAEVTGEDGWENSFAGMSSIFIPAKEILSHSYNLNAATEKNNVRFDDTYLDIINAAKINISAGRNSASKEAMLKIIEKMTQGTGDIIGIVNSDDMLYNNNVIEKLAEYYEDDIDVYRGKEIVKNFDSGYEYVLSPSLVFKKNPITFHVCHMATYIRKDAFERFGLYDETFRYLLFQ